MSFDIDGYAASAAPVSLAGLDLAAFREQPLSAGALRCLRYMHDVESHTVCYLRDLLLTPSHRDPRITTFLSMWNYEEFWHGEALGRVLAAHGEAARDARIGPMRARLGWRDRLGPFVSGAGSALVGEDFVALHMTWGAVNEWSTHAGYARLAEREGHPVLTELLARIMRQETRHVAFYVSEARDRLARSSRARRVTRWALRRLWAPVGSGVMPPQESRFLMTWLMGGDSGARAVARIDRNIDRLPGLEGLHLVARAVDGLESAA